MEYWTPQQREALDRMCCAVCGNVDCHHSDPEWLGVIPPNPSVATKGGAGLRFADGASPATDRAGQPQPRVLPAGPRSSHNEPVGSFYSRHHPTHSTADSLSAVRAGGEIIIEHGRNF